VAVQASCVSSPVVEPLWLDQLRFSFPPSLFLSFGLCVNPGCGLWFETCLQSVVVGWPILGEFSYGLLALNVMCCCANDFCDTVNLFRFFMQFFGPLLTVFAGIYSVRVET